MATGEFRFNFGGNAVAHDEEHVLVTAPAKEFSYAERAIFVSHAPVTFADAAGVHHFTLHKAVVESDAATKITGGGPESASDLVPGKYEGGFKLWEGATDLAGVLLQRWGAFGSASERPLAGKRVLELGCGHGLPGIVALLLGADCVFHDFNEEVLQSVTCPNVCANLRARGDAEASSCTHRYFSGDFLSVGQRLASEGAGAQFDFVLTSESIYNPKSAEQLLEASKLCLNAGGVLFVAAKTHYFGVGGGLAAFKQAVERGHAFDLDVLWKADEGSGNMREVLALTLRPGAAASVLTS